MEVQFNIKLSQSQQELFDLANDKEHKYVTAVFSRQSGKSVLMMVLCIQWLLEKNNTIAYICRNFILAKKLYRELIKIIPKNIIKSSNGTDFFIESIYGSTLTFYSSEQGSSLRGQTFTHCINDEFAFFKMEQTDGTHLWNDILSPTLKSRGKKCIFVSTPLGKNILYTMYLRGLSDDFPQYASILKTVYDDGFATPEQIEEIRKSIPDLSFRTEYLCEFTDNGVSFFSGFEHCFTDYDFNENEGIYVGVDLSANGEDNTIVTFINDSMQTKQFKIEGTLDMKYTKIANLINSIKNLRGAYLENNGVGTPMIAEIKKLVRNRTKIYEWNTSNSSKEEIVSDMAVKIANKEIFFNNDNKELFAELGSFIVKYTKGGRMQFEAQSGKHDDFVLSCCIALRARNDFKFKNNITRDNFVKSNIKFYG